MILMLHSCPAMLMLLFQCGEERYALECRYILTIVPLVRLIPQGQAPPYIAGLMRYFDKLVPVVDLCQLLRGKAAAPRLSTRIILVEHSLEQKRQIWGLMAEKVTETVAMEEMAFTNGQLVMDEQGVIQQVRLDRLASKVKPQLLLMGDEGDNSYY